MKQTLIFFILAIPLFCLAQSNLTRYYDYDLAGNRVLRKTLTVNPAPPAPPDSLQVTSDELRFTNDKLRFTNDGVKAEQFFIEKIARVEIKIYPNPTAEKVTLEIANMERLERGIFLLYSLTGQLLQEYPVSSATTAISLANLPKGAYILKVYINDHTEDWKIIKN